MKNSIKNILELQAISITLKAVMFLTNFYIISFFWRRSAPELTGLGRLTLCMVAASGLTWMMTSLAKSGTMRLTLIIIMLSVLGLYYEFSTR